MSRDNSLVEWPCKLGNGFERGAARISEFLEQNRNSTDVNRNSVQQFDRDNRFSREFFAARHAQECVRPA